MNDLEKTHPWLQPSISQLNNYINQNRLPQALLITGHKGLGKQLLAQYFSQSLLCSASDSTGNYCGLCQSCKLFNAATHPDYILIEPEETGKAIGIAVIRQLTEKLSLKPQFESQRIVIINPADGLNNASANAFLKYLEEPTERTSIILITDNPAKLPATIRSRCQKLPISAPNTEQLKHWLQQQGVTEETGILLNLAQGAPLLAKQFAETSTLKLRIDCFNSWLKLTQSEKNLIPLAEQWFKLDKTEIDLLLFWLSSWVIDIIKLSYQQPVEKIVNQDLATHLQELAKKLNLKELYKYYDFLLLSKQRLDMQLNKQLMFEEILIQWIKLNSR